LVDGEEAPWGALVGAGYDPNRWYEQTPEAHAESRGPRITDPVHLDFLTTIQEAKSRTDCLKGLKKFHPDRSKHPLASQFMRRIMNKCQKYNWIDPKAGGFVPDEPAKPRAW